MKKVYQVHGHKSESNLIHAHKIENIVTPELKNTIKRVVSDCKICQKFKKSVPRPKTSFPKATDFNQIVTLDLKEIAGKYILWIICSFTRYMFLFLIKRQRL